MRTSAERIQPHTLLCAAFFVIAVTSSFGEAGEKAALRYSADTPCARQLELVRSAAPPEISDQATLYILSKNGYEIVQKGTNGFSCMVDRELPETQEPQCFDAEGSATTLLARMRVETLRAQGVPEDKIAAEIEDGYKTGKYKAPRKTGIVYMLSTENWVLADPATRQIVHFGPHLMFYAPYVTDRDIGNNKGPDAAPGVPFVVHPGRPDALIIVVPKLPDKDAVHVHR
jgi:hypothetical protein